MKASQLKKAVAFLAIGLLVLLPATSAMATTPSNVATVALSITVNSSFTISATPASLSFSSAGVASGPITISSVWSIGFISNAVNVDAYFATPSAALSSGPGSISSANVLGAVNGGAANAFTQTDSHVSAAVAGATLPIGSSTLGIGTQTDTLLLSITGLGAVTPGAYTGTLNISGQDW